jgi:hypothetical protein
MPPRRETIPTTKENPRRIKDQTHQGVEPPGAAGAADPQASPAPTQSQRMTAQARRK